jgi:hypothetical protein
MKVLHVLRSPEDERALTTARAHARDHETSLLLLHDAAKARPPGFPGVVYVCVEDGDTLDNRYRPIDYDEIVRLLFSHDRVVVW